MKSVQLVKILLIWFVLIIALVLRLTYVLGNEYEPLEFDQKNYTVMAEQIIEQGVYGYLSTESNTYVTPGFPLFLTAILAVFGYTDIEQTYMVVRVLQAFISLAAIGFLYKIGDRLFNWQTGIVAALMAAVYAPFIFVTSLILTEVIFMASLMALVYYQVKIIQENKRKDHLIAGILLALSVLIRPNILLIAPVPYIFLWFQYRKPFVKEIGWGVLAFAVGMLPWWVRNLMTFQEFIFLSKEGAANPLLGGTDPYMKGTLDWSRIDPNDQKGEAIRRIKEGLQNDPALWIRWFTVGKLKEMFWNRIYMGDYPGTVAGWYALMLPKIHKLLVLAGLMGSLVSWFINKSYRYLAAIFFIMLGTQLMFIPEPRYTIGMMLLLMLMVAGLLVQGITYASGRLGSSRRVRRAEAGGR
ncbi:hypothetical protein EDM21_15310 [Paenibacillus sp. N10]|uniref:Glycosyltransferase RgtA/B/C/D-like domain-containing protein n=1 Tax=Paenibacillus lutrae TaxID=2078573 RepID=A0A7X3K0A2_9BACL|nr:glycosyltransferase family 39 protein [Paenibacillus lutrae]MVP00877.1 hypothetical protein [Paenibacillus lutrae]